MYEVFISGITSLIYEIFIVHKYMCFSTYIYIYLSTKKIDKKK